MYWKELKNGYPVGKGQSDVSALAVGQIEISAEEYADLQLGEPPSTKEILAGVLAYIRNERQKLFSAFDIYKVNISYGIEVETPEEKQENFSWYQALCNLPESITLENVMVYQDVGKIIFPKLPIKVAKYLIRS